MHDAESVRRLIRIDLEAIRQNAMAVRASAGVRYADLRANAYGHGMREVARALDEVGFAGYVVSEDGRLDVPSGLSTPAVLAAQVSADDLAGLTLFGLAPGSRPAMQVSGEVLAVKRIGRGEGVSYGYSYITSEDTSLALVGVGYAHGAVRRATNTAQVRIGGQLRTISGAISMDQFSVDLRGAEAAPGDMAVLFGDPSAGEPSILDWERATGIRAAAITSRLSSRFERIHA